MSTSTAAPARICSTRSPDALNCVGKRWCRSGRCRALGPREGPSRGVSSENLRSTAFFLEGDLAEPASEPAGSDVLLPEQPARLGRRQQKARQNRGVKPYRTYSTLWIFVPGYPPTAGFNLQSDYTSARIMIMKLFSPEEYSFKLPCTSVSLRWKTKAEQPFRVAPAAGKPLSWYVRRPLSSEPHAPAGRCYGLPAFAGGLRRTGKLTTSV